MLCIVPDLVGGVWRCALSGGDKKFRRSVSKREQNRPSGREQLRRQPPRFFFNCKTGTSKTVQLCRRRTIHVLVGIPTTSLYRIARDGTSALASDRSWALYCRPICSTSRLGASRSIVSSTNQNPSQNRHISRFLPKNTKTNSILTTSPTNQQHDPSTAPVVRAGVGHRRPHRSRGG